MSVGWKNIRGGSTMAIQQELYRVAGNKHCSGKQWPEAWSLNTVPEQWAVVAKIPEFVLPVSSDSLSSTKSFLLLVKPIIIPHREG
jgi:hypothetical protein